MISARVHLSLDLKVSGLSFPAVMLAAAAQLMAELKTALTVLLIFGIQTDF